MPSIPPIPIAQNWTSAAGALEAILNYLGEPLPRHAVMGLSGHAWHFCLGTRGDVTALPSGVADIDPEWLQGAKAVGIAAGASAPEILVTEVVAFLRASEPSDVEELTVIEEDVEFLLPKELVQIESTKKSVVGIAG